MKTTELKKALASGGLDGRLIEIYGAEALAGQRARYLHAVEEFEALYGTDREAALYSVAGRSELSGNHTDHNHGCVVAASIDLDIIGRIRRGGLGHPRQERGLPGGRGGFRCLQCPRSRAV